MSTLERTHEQCYLANGKAEHEDWLELWDVAVGRGAYFSEGALSPCRVWET